MNDVTPDPGVRRNRWVPVVVAIIILVGYSLFAWLTALNFHLRFKDLPFEANFAPGLVDTVATIQALDRTHVFGPHHDVSPYLFHRLNEMLYPVMYYTPTVDEHLRPGDVYVLFPGQPQVVASRLVRQSGVFRLMEVLP